MKAFNVPINGLSFGNIAVNLLHEAYKRDLSPCIFPIGGKADLNSYDFDQNFLKWLQDNCNQSIVKHNRDNPIVKLWHLNGSLESLSKEQYLITFYELDSPTEAELNIAGNQTKLLVTSHFTKRIFEFNNLKNIEYLPPFIDRNHFKVVLDENGERKRYFDDGRIVFNLCGKLEHRKRHEKIIKAWKKRFGFTSAQNKENSRYFLQCALYNPFFHQNPEECSKLNQQEFNNILGEKTFNIKMLPYMPKNTVYNDFLNSASVIIGMSGGEGIDMPVLTSMALGKHAVILDAHVYKDYANEQNAVLVKPTGKIEAEDGRFFHGNKTPYNQGKIYDFDEDQFVDACETVIKRVEQNPTNNEGLKLQKEFTVERTFDKILECQEN